MAPSTHAPEFLGTATEKGQELRFFWCRDNEGELPAKAVALRERTYVRELRLVSQEEGVKPAPKGSQYVVAMNSQDECVGSIVFMHSRVEGEAGAEDWKPSFELQLAKELFPGRPSSSVGRFILDRRFRGSALSFRLILFAFQCTTRSQPSPDRMVLVTCVTALVPMYQTFGLKRNAAIPDPVMHPDAKCPVQLLQCDMAGVEALVWELEQVVAGNKWVMAKKHLRYKWYKWAASFAAYLDSVAHSLYLLLPAKVATQYVCNLMVWYSLGFVVLCVQAFNTVPTDLYYAPHALVHSLE